MLYTMRTYNPRPMWSTGDTEAVRLKDLQLIVTAPSATPNRAPANEAALATLKQTDHY